MASLTADAFDRSKQSRLIAETVDSQSELFDYKYGENLFKVFKTKDANIQCRKVSGDLFGAIYEAYIPKNGLLAGINIRTSLTGTTDNSTAVGSFGTLLYEWIDLCTLGSSSLGPLNTPEYMMIRNDNLSAVKKARLNNASSPNVPFNNNTVVCYTFPYFHFQEDKTCFINTDNCEQLVLRFKVANTFQDMGLAATITNLAPTVEVTSFTFYETNKPVTPLVQRNILTYNIFMEPRVFVPAASTTVRIPITCRYNSHSVGIIALNAGKTTETISRILVQQANNTVASVHKRSDWLFSDDDSRMTSSITSTMEYDFSVGNSKMFNLGELPLNKGDYFLTVTFLAATSADAYLNVIWSFWSPMIISAGGKISRYDVV